MNVSCDCSNCNNLRLLLNERKSEIDRLKMQIQSLNNLLLEYQRKACHICHCKTEIKEDNHENSLTDNSKQTSAVLQKSDILPLNQNDPQISELTLKNCNSPEIERPNISKNPEETETVEVCDSNPIKENSSDEYVYDENYKMYYCVSTGYYYNRNTGLYYIPQNGAYYTYDYSENAYVLYSGEQSGAVDKISYNFSKPQNEFDSDRTSESPKQCKGDPEKTDYCESVVHQVNNLNIGDTSDNIPKIEDTQKLLEEKGLMENECKLQDNFLLKSEDNNNVNLAHDWQPPHGTSLTVQDLVREVAEQSTGMSDYVYDENSHMYYSQSTGYYFDAKVTRVSASISDSHCPSIKRRVRNLLYDPKSGTYYIYDQESSSYNFYYQLDPTCAAASKNGEETVQTGDEKLKARQRYWRKKQGETTSTSLEDKKGNNCLIELEQNEGYSSPEEGEVFSSDSDEDLDCRVLSQPQLEQISNHRFPCIRSIVKNSDKLKIGTLILITCTGAIIGRDKSNEVFIPEVSVSKAHAEIIFDKELWKYSIKDLGSQNGTFVNNTRLSEPKKESQPVILSHGDEICIGSCKLLLHIHVGYETCNDCEPGQIMEELTNKQENSVPTFKTNEEKEKERRKEVRRLKKKYGLEGMDYMNSKNSLLTSDSIYEDKADIRRKTVGSENPYEKTEVASMERVMDKSNVGYQMLRKLGWKEGESLGATGHGISEPIPLQPWLSKAGLGSTEQQQTSMQFFPEDKKRKKWVKAQERFFQLL